MDTSVLGQISALRRMSVAELQEQWFQLYGQATKSRNRDYLWKRLSWRAQELAYEGLSERAKSRIEELAPDTFIRARTPAQAIPAPQRDPRLPSPGTVIVKAYKRRELRLMVRDDHFELDGQCFRSLSEAARYVTGARWSGWLFWGLRKRSRKS